MQSELSIILANPRGFCAGVNMAIEVVEQVLKTRGAPVYVYHEIVHNRHVVEHFRSRGVTFVNHISEIPEESVVVYSAHGVSPAVRAESKQRKLIEVDATCPLVTKVHSEVKRFARDGYTIIFIGHHNHDEAVGTVGEAPESIMIVETPEEVEKLQVPDESRIAYVTQTTLSLSDCAKVVDALKERFPNIRAPHSDDICYATTNRQQAVSEFAEDVQLALVIGSRNSSNSQRLVERAKEAGAEGYLIDDASEIEPKWLAGVTGVLITAGASAPDHLVQELIDHLKTSYNGRVETRTLVEEDVSFELPKSARSLPVVS